MILSIFCLDMFFFILLTTFLNLSRGQFKSLALSYPLYTWTTRRVNTFTTLCLQLGYVKTNTVCNN